MQAKIGGNLNTSSLFSRQVASHTQERVQEQHLENDQLVQGLTQNIQKPAYRTALLWFIKTLQTSKNAEKVNKATLDRLNFTAELLGLPSEDFQKLTVLAQRGTENTLFRSHYTPFMNDLLDNLGYSFWEKHAPNTTRDAQLQQIMVSLFVEQYGQALKNQDLASLEKFLSNPYYADVLFHINPGKDTAKPLPVSGSARLVYAPFYHSQDFAAQCIDLFAQKRLQDLFAKKPLNAQLTSMFLFDPSASFDSTKNFVQTHLAHRGFITVSELVGVLHGRDFLQKHIKSTPDLLKAAVVLGYLDQTLVDSLCKQPISPHNRVELVEQIQDLMKGKETLFKPNLEDGFQNANLPVNCLDKVDRICAKALKNILKFTEINHTKITVQYWPTWGVNKNETSWNIEAMLLLNTRLLLSGYAPQLDANLSNYLKPEQIDQITAFIDAAAGDRTAFLQHGLALAVQYNCPIAAEYFLELGADAEATTPAGQSLLVCAVESENYDVAATLYEPQSLPPKLTQKLRARCSTDPLFQKKWESLERFIQARRTRMKSGDKAGLTAFALGFKGQNKDDVTPQNALEQAFLDPTFDTKPLNLIAAFVTGLQPPRKLLP